MPSDRATSNTATLRRLHDAINTGDAEHISKTIDAIVEPDVLIRTPLPVDATGARALKEVFSKLYRAFPDLHIAVEDLIAEGDKVVRSFAIICFTTSLMILIPVAGPALFGRRGLHDRVAGTRVIATSAKG